SSTRPPIPSTYRSAPRLRGLAEGGSRSSSGRSPKSRGPRLDSLRGAPVRSESSKAPRATRLECESGVLTIAAASGRVKTIRHLGHLARLPARSSVTSKGVAHPGQANEMAIAGASMDRDCIVALNCSGYPSSRLALGGTVLNWPPSAKRKQERTSMTLADAASIRDDKPMRFLITGATGFIGGHVAEACRDREQLVSAVVRPTSNATELEKLGVSIHRGELSDAALLRPIVADTDVVVHCAAKVGDWGPVEEYRQANVENLRVLLDACKGQALSRFI